MLREMESKIKELEELLRKERENLVGNAKDREETLKREIENLKN